MTVIENALDDLFLLYDNGTDVGYNKSLSQSSSASSSSSSSSTSSDIPLNSSATGVSSRDYVYNLPGASLFIYGLPIVIVVGTVGNALTVVVLMRKRMRTTTVHFYLVVLACADTSSLYAGGLKAWVRTVFDAELLHISDPGCKILTFLILLSRDMAAWLLVLIAMDRYMLFLPKPRAGADPENSKARGEGETFYNLLRKSANFTHF